MRVVLRGEGRGWAVAPSAPAPPTRGSSSIPKWGPRAPAPDCGLSGAPWRHGSRTEPPTTPTHRMVTLLWGFFYAQTACRRWVILWKIPIFAELMCIYMCILYIRFCRVWLFYGLCFFLINYLSVYLKYFLIWFLYLNSSISPNSIWIRSLWCVYNLIRFFFKSFPTSIRFSLSNPSIIFSLFELLL